MKEMLLLALIEVMAWVCWLSYKSSGDGAMGYGFLAFFILLAIVGLAFREEY